MDSYRLFRIAGIDVRVHWSWFAVFFLLIWWLSDGLFREVYDDWSTAEVWTAGVVAALFFFVSVLLHELAHSLVAKRLGLGVSSITLFIFGGVSSLTSEPPGPGQEFKVAIVGPLTSFALAASCGVITVVALIGGWENSPPAAIAEYLATVNIALGIFNLLPGFPLDGGRVFRAAVWSRTGSMLTATRWAATSGTIIAFGLIAAGVISILMGSFVGGAWFVVIGWFLRGAAESSYQQLLTHRTLEGVRVRDVLNRNYVDASPEDNLARVVNDYMLASGQRCVPVLAGEELLGLLTIEDLKKVPREQWAETSAFRVMTPREKLHVTGPNAWLAEALDTMARNDVHQLPVLDGRSLLGFVTRADVLRLMQVRSEVGETIRV